MADGPGRDRFGEATAFAFAVAASVIVALLGATCGFVSYALLPCDRWPAHLALLLVL